MISVHAGYVEGLSVAGLRYAGPHDHQPLVDGAGPAARPHHPHRASRRRTRAGLPRFASTRRGYDRLAGDSRRVILACELARRD